MLGAAGLQVIDLTRQQEMTKQQEMKAKEAEFRAQAAAQAKVSLHTYDTTPACAACTLPALMRVLLPLGRLLQADLGSQAFLLTQQGCSWHSRARHHCPTVTPVIPAPP